MHITTHLDVDLVALESEDRLTLMLDLAAPAQPAGDASAARPPATLQVVLDRSGSMAGDRLETAKRALDALITRLDPADRLGVVAFDDEVAIVVPAGPLDDKPAAREAVAALAPGGSTNLSGGLLRGLQEARRASHDAGATVLLLSDGHANCGETDADRLGAVAAKARRSNGITLSTLGLGLDHDERLLAALSRGGAGNAHFAEEADTAGALLASEVDGLLATSAQAASLLIRPAAGVSGVTLWNDLPGHATSDGIMIELGDLVAGEERKLVLTFEVPAMAGLGLAKVADVTVRWVSLPALEEHTVDVPVHVNVVPGDQAAGRIADPTVRSELAYQLAQRTKRDAAQALREGRADDARRLWSEGGDALTAAARSAPPPRAEELRDEADLLASYAQRTGYDDPRRVAKQSETDGGRKSRRRGRGDLR